MRTRHVISGMLAAALLAACTAPTATGTGGRGSGGRSTPTKPAAGGSPAAVAPAGAPVAGPGAAGALISDKGAVVVSNNGASLAGLVRVPATLVSNNGGNIVSNNGGGVISNNGGGVVSNNGAGYRLQALEQAPLAGATVRLVDAKGAPVAGADGRPLTAVAGPDGAYAFTAALPARNLMLEVDLPGGKGTLRAVAPADAEARKRTDVELVSTLVADYVVEKYVRSQAVDAQVVLDRLPAEVERATRGRTEDALAAGQAAGAIALPVTLAGGAAVATVEALRARDQALDGQLETVRRLLVIAGRADIGSGRLATEVGFPAGGLSTAVLPDGRVVLAADHHVWKVGPDGRLVLIAGGTPGVFDDVEEPVEGKPATEATLAMLSGLLVAPDGSLLIVEQERTLRLGADGQLRVVAQQPYQATVFVDRDGVVHALEQSPGERGGPAPAARLWRYDTPEPAAPIHVFDAAATAELAGLRRAARAADGAILLATTRAGAATIRRLDLATRALTTALPATEGDVVLADDGTAWRLPAPGGSTLTPLTAGAAPLRAPADLDPWPYALTRLGPGSYLLTGATQVFRVDAQGATLVAGAAAAQGAGDALGLSLASPTALAVAPDGTLRVFDNHDYRVWKVTPGGQAEPVGALVLATAAGPQEFAWPYRLSATADGATWFQDQAIAAKAVLRLAADGTLTEAYRAPEPDYADPEARWWELRDYHVAPDGTLTTLLVDTRGFPSGLALETRGPDGQVTSRREATTEAGVTMTDAWWLAPAPGGAFYVGGVCGLLRWGAEAAPTALVAADAWSVQGVVPNATDAAVANTVVRADARGRVYAVVEGAVRAWDPATGKASVLFDLGTTTLPGFDPVAGLSAPVLDAAGDLLFLNKRRQVVRVPAADLP